MEEKDQGSFTGACIEWAFAGKSHTTPKQTRKDGQAEVSHTVWEHWIDSKSDNPGPDEGDMYLQGNGDLLERGTQKHPVTGEETEYEELWHDLDVEGFGKKHNRNTLVMKAEDSSRNLRGMVIKVGGWCQGIMKKGDALTVERWQYRPGSLSEEDQKSWAWNRVGEPEDRTRNEWLLNFRAGQGVLPCKAICEQTSGKFGLNQVFKRKSEDLDKEADWKVVEEYYY